MSDENVRIRNSRITRAFFLAFMTFAYKAMAVTPAALGPAMSERHRSLKIKLAHVCVEESRVNPDRMGEQFATI